jgi:predicted dehydrogenase
MSDAELVLAQYGCGYWGPNLLRAFSGLSNCWVKYVADSNAERRSFVEKAFPKTKAVESPDVVLSDTAVDAIVVATPAASHFELASDALLAGKHVLVEKPLATKVSEVEVLERQATERGLVLMAGHTFIFNGAVRYVKRMIESGDLGEIRYIYSQRLNLGRIRSDVDALWNLAPHDVSIIQYWLDDPAPLSIRRLGMDFVQPGVDDVVFLNILYPKQVLASIHVSWLDPQKVRKMVVVGSRRMVVYDDMIEDKIAIFDKGIERMAVLGEGMEFDNPRPGHFSYRSGDILLPKINLAEPLRTEAEHFVQCIRTGEKPLTGAAHAKSVIAILERAEDERANHG